MQCFIDGYRIISLQKDFYENHTIHLSVTKLLYSSLRSLISFIFYEHLKHQNLDDDEYVKEHLSVVACVHNFPLGDW